ncbi:DNA excision repair protein ERCC-6-like 2 [Ceratobasidium sp. AG-Ba]|nr:DNA excision repair protein ERCC-6-like 2 [Ceratobasidium sp. AG-Ba]
MKISMKCAAGLEEEIYIASSSQLKLEDTWRHSPAPNAEIASEHTRSEPNTEPDDTATESESDSDDNEATKPGKVPSKRPSRTDILPRKIKRARKSPTLPVDSGTETESSDNDPFIPSTASTAISISTLNNGLEGTSNSGSSSNYDPKRMFPPPPDQAHLGPLHLYSADPAYEARVPASINRQLREYQRDGVRFFHQRWAEGRGGMLGDDMGLGKTIQVIAFLSAALGKTGDSSDMHRRRDRVRALQDEGLARVDLPRADKKWGTCLIICPKTVVGNWERELDTWSYFEYATYLGDKGTRDDVLKDFTMGRLDIVLTAFDTARTNIDLLSDLPWTMVFVDEVHRCKNPSSGITIALNKFSCRVRFGLTGTAIQNGYKELWTLLDWCAPGKVGTQNQWKLAISVPLAEGQAHRATQAQVSKARLLAERLVHRLLPVFFLRRTKALIADQMPRKFDQVVFCPLAKTQLEVYKRFLETKDVQLMTRKDEPCDCGSTKGLTRLLLPHPQRPRVPWKDLVLKYMQLFVEISNHIILICPGFKGETDEQRARRREYVKIAFPGQTIRQADLLHDDSLCGKWNVLSQLLDTWKTEGENKVLIFSKSVKILEMLDDQMRRKNFNFCYMDGKTKQEDRKKASLTRLSYLILIGIQLMIYKHSMDRAYRFGQKRDVNVYRLLGAGALEELIYARQIYKQQQMQIGYEASVQTRYFEGVQGSKTHQGELFGLKNIFKLHETALATKMTIEKANLAEINWALANMDSAPDGMIKDSLPNNERTLADFMLDESVPAPVNDNISDVLNGAGVAYSHNHQNVLMVSHVEKKITSTAIAGSRREYGEAVVTLANEGVPEKKATSMWPPRRKAAAELTPMERLEARVEALVELGLIKDRDSLADFGREFARMPDPDQRAILLDADRAAAEKIRYA